MEWTERIGGRCAGPQHTALRSGGAAAGPTVRRCCTAPAPDTEPADDNAVVLALGTKDDTPLARLRAGEATSLVQTITPALSPIDPESEADEVGSHIDPEPEADEEVGQRQHHVHR